MPDKRILVVDDSCIYQRLLSDVINSHSGIEVVGVAADGKYALESMSVLRPDLVTLDILMPEFDGIQTLMELRRKWPGVRTVMVSSLTSAGSDAALDALALGACEYVAKPAAAGGVASIKKILSDNLIPKIEALCGIDQIATKNISGVVPALKTQSTSVQRSLRAEGSTIPEVVVIGVSTGGPDALAKVLVQLPADIGVPIVIVQHMPVEFTGKLAARLNAACALTVREAERGDVLSPGYVYIAPGDFHLTLADNKGVVSIELDQNPPENSCRPSVDPLFRSAAVLYGDRCLGIIMTGMGQDGLRGSEALFAAGSSIIVQDEASSVVWGMPKLVAMAGLAEQQVPLNQIAIRILERVHTASVRNRSARSKHSGAENVASPGGMAYGRNVP